MSEVEFRKHRVFRETEDVIFYDISVEESNASDLHLSTTSTPMVRIDGLMQPLQLPNLKNEDMIIIKEQVLINKVAYFFKKDGSEYYKPFDESYVWMDLVK